MGAQTIGYIRVSTDRQDLATQRHLSLDYAQQGVTITFIRQPELWTTGPHGKLLLAIYSYFAEAEREFVSMRVKQRLAADAVNGDSGPDGLSTSRRAPLSPRWARWIWTLDSRLNVLCFLKGH